jgi:hypothetical protein
VAFVVSVILFASAVRGSRLGARGKAALTGVGVEVP